MKRLCISLGVLSLLWLQGCAPSSTPASGGSPTTSEIVMAPGMTITATTPNGTITVSAGTGMARSYTWDGATRSVQMWPRSQRWNGSLGLYYPGPGFHWKSNEGIARGVLEEGQQHFKTVNAALKWIRARTWMPHLYTKSGLVVGWMKVPARRQLNVDVWQIYINGRKPSNLPGSQDNKIVVDYSKVLNQSAHNSDT